MTYYWLYTHWKGELWCRHTLRGGEPYRSFNAALKAARRQPDKWRIVRVKYRIGHEPIALTIAQSKGAKWT